MNVGDKVNKGDIIGYVEAMKVLNEVTTDVAGEITEIVADHGTMLNTTKFWYVLSKGVSKCFVV